MKGDWKLCWKKPVQVCYREVIGIETIHTREGTIKGYENQDVIIKGIKDEEYPCKKDIFAATYTTEAPISLEQSRQQGREEQHDIEFKRLTQTVLNYKESWIKEGRQEGIDAAEKELHKDDDAIFFKFARCMKCKKDYQICRCDISEPAVAPAQFGWLLKEAIAAARKVK